MGIQFNRVIKMIGYLIVATGVFMLIPTTLSLLSDQQDLAAFLKSIGICLSLGIAFMLIKADLRGLNKREGYLVVGVGWMVICLFGSFPYYFMNHHVPLVQSIFESVSGFTTTGATIFNDIEELSQPILLWRSLTQWIGGMGIIVFTIAISPLLGIGGVELFVAESPGPTTDKIHPRIKEVAKRLWFLYIGLTMTLCMILYFVSGLSFFDAINHALTTLSTGGFSTKNASIAHFDSVWVEYPIILFMFIGGINFTILYYLFKGKFSKAWSSEEFKQYMIVTILVIVGVASVLILLSHYGIEESLRTSAFHVISVITTTGFVTADYTYWHPGLTTIFLLLSFAGASAGSTSGGIKFIRHIVFVKNALLEFKRLLHPNAYVRLKIDGNVVKGRIITHVLVFLLFYLFILSISSVVVSILESSASISFISYVGLSITCLSNVGPAIGSIGPLENFATLNDATQLFLSLIMIIGRLEIFTVIIIFTPYFWRNR